MPRPDLFRRLAERFLAPWYDRAAEQAKLQRAEDKLAHSEEVRQRAIRARQALERVQEEYVSQTYRERLTGVVEPRPRL